MDYNILTIGKYKGYYFHRVCKENILYAKWCIINWKDSKNQNACDFIEYAKDYIKYNPFGVGAQSAMGSDILTVGKYKGKSFHSVCKENISYAKWCIINWKDFENQNACDFIKYVKDYLQSVDYILDTDRISF